ncbi:MAG: hypothetical protein RIR69_1331 [Actinomycetota bacterium]|jgi:pyridoxal phosphate enzyme (YggS family)
MIDPADVADRVEALRQEVRDRAGHDVALIAVTKSFGCDAIQAAASAGCDGIGENYAQELLEKTEAGCIDLPVHFIGALQSNKIRQIAPFVSLWQSIDRSSLIDELARRAPGAQVLLQVNTTGEGSKSGVVPGEVEALHSHALRAGLVVQGVMTIGPTAGDHASRLSAFRQLRQIADSLGVSICSMGMSEDYREALDCGSTMLRIGSALFGPRGALRKTP